MINKLFTQGRRDAQDDISFNRRRKWNESGYRIIYNSKCPVSHTSEKHVSSEYISGYTSAYEIESFLKINKNISH